jgi:hypothetical protein
MATPPFGGEKAQEPSTHAGNWNLTIVTPLPRRQILPRPLLAPLLSSNGICTSSPWMRPLLSQPEHVTAVSHKRRSVQVLEPVRKETKK